MPPPSSYFSDIISHFSMGNYLIPAIINTGTAANEPRAAPALAVTPWAGSFPGPSPHQRGQRRRGAHGGAERGRAVPPPGLWQAPGHSTAPLVLLPNPPPGRAAPHSLWSTGLSKLQGTGTAELNYSRCSPVCPTTPLEGYPKKQHSPKAKECKTNRRQKVCGTKFRCRMLAGGLSPCSPGSPLGGVWVLCHRCRCQCPNAQPCPSQGLPSVPTSAGQASCSTACPRED